VPEPLAIDPRRARIAVTATFLVNGIAVPSFITRIPAIRTGLGLREAVLGTLLSLLAVGVVLGLVAAGRLIPRVGSRVATLTGALVMIAAMPTVGFAVGPVTLAIALLVMGFGSSVMDVGMNAQGVGVERVLERSVLLGMHGAWSLGALLAALIGAAAIALRVPVTIHLGAIAVLVLVAMLALAPSLRVEDRIAADTAAGFAWPRGALLPLGLVALAGALGEATANDWSGIHLQDVVGVDVERIGWGFVAFTAAMTTVRLLGDLAVRRLGASLVLRIGGGLAGLGFLLIALVPHLPAALIGFVFVGLGVGGTVPLAFAAAGRVADSPGAGVAAVATVGYLAFVIGPTMIGLITEAAGLPVAFALVGVVIAAATVRRQPGLDA
jgi:MFS family permease